jgi:hypothetical protein
MWYSILCFEHFTDVHYLVTSEVVLAKCVIFCGGSRHPLPVGNAACGSLFMLRFSRIDQLVRKLHGPDTVDFMFLTKCQLLGKINFTEIIKFLINACNCMSISV